MQHMKLIIIMINEKIIKFGRITITNISAKHRKVNEAFLKLNMK